MWNHQWGSMYHWNQCCGGCSLRSIASLVDICVTHFNCTKMHTVRSTMTAQSSVNLLFLLIIVPDVILEAPLTTYQHMALDNMIWLYTTSWPDNHWAWTEVAYIDLVLNFKRPSVIMVVIHTNICSPKHLNKCSFWLACKKWYVETLPSHSGLYKIYLGSHHRKLRYSPAAHLLQPLLPVILSSPHVIQTPLLIQSALLICIPTSIQSWHSLYHPS